MLTLYKYKELSAMKLWINILFSVCMTLSILSIAPGANAENNATSHNQIILFIWDGLRPDSISPNTTPHLYHLMKDGVDFTDNHSSYPTFTMMNAASFATGDFAGKTGFYGNTLWNPEAHGTDATKTPVDFQQPVFTEDYKILQALNRPKENDPLVFVGTLFEAAHQANITTAVVGKSGPAFFQDYRETTGMHGIVLEEKHVYPLAFAKQLQKENYPLPALSPHAYTPGALVLTDKSDPTAFSKVVTLKSIFAYPENVTSDPSATNISPYAQANAYLMKTYLNKILTTHPRLSVIWLRNPDTTEHNYGVGSPSYTAALTSQDQLLGELLNKLKQLHLLKHTDLIVASDHGHSNVAGSLSDFPLRNIDHGRITTINPHGYSVSGYFRPADLLTRAGFTAYDGSGCQYNPVLSGIQRDGKFIYPIREDDTGKICGGKNVSKKLYTTPSYTVPQHVPDQAIIVAANGGSTYLYVPSHHPKLIQKLVRFLQSREEFGVVFVDSRYGSLPGTFPLTLVHIENPQHRNPDIIVSSTYDENAVISGMKGTEYSVSGNNRGNHGSFSPIDVHNTLIAIGPDFKSHNIDRLPTGNVDVAPTIAYLLHIPLPDASGRPLLEALKNGVPTQDYRVLHVVYEPRLPAKHLNMQLPIDPDGKEIDHSVNNYTARLYTKWLTVRGKSYIYFDKAKAIRY